MNHRRERAGDRGSDRGETNRTPAARRGSAQARQAGDRAFGRPPKGPQWPGRVPSQAELDGVPATDTHARTPLGVGTSTTRRAERIARTEPEAGRRWKGIRGRSGRPYGKSEPEHDTGVAPPRRITDGSPHLPTGDQAS